MTQREVAGVQITREGSVIIHGSSNMAGAVAATVLIDGVAVGGNSLSNFPPLWVKSITVLKGSAAAIYGVRGYGGVIIITTRNFDSKE